MTVHTESSRYGRAADHPTVLRLILLAIALGCVAFVAYGSLVPFHLQWVPFDEALGRFRAVLGGPAGRFSGSDFLSNVALLIPASFFLTGALADRSRRMAVAVLPVVAAGGFAVALAVEFGQLYSPGRTPSPRDVWAQLLGSVIGCLLWAAAGPICSAWLQRFTRIDSPRHLVITVLGIYAVAWVILAVLPFDFSIRPAELAQKWRRGRVVVIPFTYLQGVDMWLDFGGTLLRAVPIGALALLTSTRRGFERTLAAVASGVAAVLVLEGLQLLALSRTADSTDVLAGSLGIVAGAIAADRWLLSGEHVTVSSGRPAVRVWPLFALVLWSGVLAARHWAPFDFTTDPAFVRDRLARMLSRVPFESYYWAPPLDALGEALIKISLSIPVGVLLPLFWPGSGGRVRQVIRLLAFVSFAAVMFGGIEFGQLLVPGRVPDLTDVMLGVIGTVVGVVLVGLVRHAPTRPGS